MTHSSPVWPNFYIVGAPKAGTTSLYAHLRGHAQVFLPRLKEPEYFATNPPPPGLDVDVCVGDLDKYQRLYRGAERFPAIGDASTSYLWDENSARSICRVCPNARIVVILRDPISRAHSAYLMDRRAGSENEPCFYRALLADVDRDKSSIWSARLYVERGYYCEQVRRYFDTFGRDSVLVLLQDELSKSPTETLTRMACHIGIDPQGFDSSRASHAYHAYKQPRWTLLHRILTRGKLARLRRKVVPSALTDWFKDNPLLYGRGKKPTLEARARAYLQAIFEPDVRALEDLLGRSLPELRKSWVQ